MGDGDVEGEYLGIVNTDMNELPFGGKKFCQRRWTLRWPVLRHHTASYVIIRHTTSSTVLWTCGRSNIWHMSGMTELGC